MCETLLSMYEDWPRDTLQLNRQIQIAIERMELYKILQSLENPSAEILKLRLENCVLKHLLEPGDCPETREALKIDLIGHWTLRLAYSCSDYNFFVTNEIKWFEVRFNTMTDQEKVNFLRINKFPATPVSDEEKSNFNLEGSHYKIYFADATALVRLRKYPLHKGYIFIPLDKLVYCVSQRLSKYLRNVVPHVQKMLPLCYDGQLKTILSSLILFEPVNRDSALHLKLEDLDQQAKHFPPCMKHQYEKLKEKHHLNHFSRVQYGLFLKGLGLSLDDALKMWSDELLKIMSENRFQKEYVYFFKHLYGRVGSKINYQPWKCAKIIEQSVSLGATHGCPFRHWDFDVLGKRLAQEKIRDEDVGEIFNFKSEKRYTKACARYFRCVGGCYPRYDIASPQEYYENSCASAVYDIEDIWMSDVEEN